MSGYERPNEPLILVECNDSVHDGKCVKVATFQSDTDRVGNRASINLLDHLRYTRDGRVIVRTGRDDAEVVNRSTHEPLAREVVLDANDQLVHDPNSGDADDTGWRWHYELRCSCGIGLRARREPLLRIIEKLLNNRVSRVELSTLRRLYEIES